MSLSGVSAGNEATPKLAVIARSTPGTATCATSSELLREHDGAVERGVRQQDQKLLAAVAAGEIAFAERGAEGSAGGRERLVALLVSVDVVDLLEVVEIAEDGRERQLRPGSLGDHSHQALAQAARVGEPRQAVRCRAHLGDGEVAEVGEHRRRLADRLVDPAPLRLRQRQLVGDEHGADHLAADERGHARRPLLLAAEPHMSSGSSSTDWA